MSSINLKKWQCAEDSESSRKCWSRWWKKSERPVGAGTIINYAEDEPSLDVPGALADTGGRIYVRQEYVDMEERVQVNMRSTIMEAIKALVVTGHPGIGKSVFGIYLLILRLRKGQTTCTYHHDLEFPCTFYSEDGVYQTQDTSVLSKLPHETVCLVDMEDAKEPPPAYLTTNRKVWVIQFASPDKSSWGHWSKKRRAPVLCMNPWDLRELTVAFNIHDVSESTNSTDSEISDRLQGLIQDFGPVPRAVFARAWLQSRDYTQEEIDTVGKVAPDELHSILAGSYKSEGSHQIVITTRKDAKHPEPGQSDLRYTEIISKRMLHLLEDKALELSFVQTRSLIRLFSAAPQISITAEWLFETYAHKIITLDMPQDQAFGLPQLRPMVGEKANSLRHMTNGSLSSPHYLPHSKHSCLHHYSGIKNVLQELRSGTRRYFIPTKTNNPLFDALLIMEHEPEKQAVPSAKKRKAEIEPEAVQPKFDVYVLQMTTAHEHGGSAAGYEPLESLKASGMVEHFAYVLVVPLRSPDPNYTWEMPDGWNTSGVKGDVYCLEVNIDI